jgi:hypothetical protein
MHVGSGGHIGAPHLGNKLFQFAGSHEFSDPGATVY